MIVLYTVDCPKCKVLEKKLESNGIEFEKCYDVDKMLELGFKQSPQLQVNDKIMNFNEAIKWINEKG